jgi:hypothetical protein
MEKYLVKGKNWFSSTTEEEAVGLTKVVWFFTCLLKLHENGGIYSRVGDYNLLKTDC